MYKDSTIETIIKDIKEKFKKEFNKELSEERIFEIIDSQFSIIPYAMKKGYEVKLDKFAKFTINPARVVGINTGKDLKEGKISKEERDTLIKNVVNENKLPTLVFKNNIIPKVEIYKNIIDENTESK
jgi:nucleoid DNA-binding protein